MTVAIIFGLALGAACTWWWTSRPTAPLSPAQAPTAAPPAATTSDAPAPAVSGPASPETVAVNALRGLRSVNLAEVSYQDFVRQVGDTKRSVEDYLQRPEGDAQLKRSVDETLQLYMLAAVAWNAATRANAGDDTAAAAVLGAVAEHPAIVLCPALRVTRDNARAEPQTPVAVARGLAVTTGVPTILQCAASKLDEVERELRFR